MFMDIEETIRFRVLREQFTDATPTNHPITPSGRRQSVVESAANSDLAGNSTKIPPYSLTVSFFTIYTYFLLTLSQKVCYFRRWFRSSLMVGSSIITPIYTYLLLHIQHSLTFFFFIYINYFIFLFFFNLYA